MLKNNWIFQVQLILYLNIKDNFLKEKILYLPKNGNFYVKKSSEIIDQFYELK